ncbi:putative phosphoacetylglucosamine mutase [Hamiltosporidium tvaerminnensis]|uniref:Putative phosphoacetylglucosamine mutase n=1 Tax=Hamiltosporidium tvaerminnensis TaxID=1176355 RepID=A0A4Q9LC04_9MICR|nr:Phosphoacetylglucosamine Mutase [Hamiltosporidium tvaerminnensis]TBU05379.1 putative phosphoacetylglucosamine mutase [Hamiltosporidium tvaerminnensis]
MQSDKKSVQKIFENLPTFLKKTDKKYIYEPSGLRGNASDIIYAVCRTSIVAYIRSSTFCGKMIGIMITASHNPIEDNGIKICDHNGEFLDNSWEKICNEAINCSDTNLYPYLNRIHRKYGNMREFNNGPIGHILIGMDNRPSSITLFTHIAHTLQHFNCKVHNYKQVTTPQLFFLTKFSNQNGEPLHPSEYIKTLSRNYINLYNHLQTTPPLCYIDTANGVIQQNINLLKKEIPENILNIEIMNKECEEISDGYSKENSYEEDDVVIKDNVDERSGYRDKERSRESNEETSIESNKDSKNTINNDVNDTMNISIDKNINNGINNDVSNTINTQSEDLPTNLHLNNHCGSNYIKNTNKLPKNIKIDPHSIKRAVSFDGDADRLLLFWHDTTLNLITGDRIATLFLTYIHSLLYNTNNIDNNPSSDINTYNVDTNNRDTNNVDMRYNNPNNNHNPNINPIINNILNIPFTIGVILSHYSNYAAINFLKKKFPYKNITIKISPVGIKNFYKYASTFDIGIYFEPNGHGGIFFSSYIRSHLERVKKEIESKIELDNVSKIKVEKIEVDGVVFDVVDSDKSDLNNRDEVEYRVEYNKDNNKNNKDTGEYIKANNEVEYRIECNKDKVEYIKDNNEVEYRVEYIDNNKDNIKGNNKDNNKDNIKGNNNDNKDTGEYKKNNNKDNNKDNNKNNIKDTNPITHHYNNIVTLLNIIPFFDTSISDAFSTFLSIHLICKNNYLSKILKKYQELFTREITVKVKNKNIIKVDLQNTVIQPILLQNKIEEYMYKYKGRSFIRPSQSEDFIRVYTESSSKIDTDVMCVCIAQCVYDTCEGIGYHPEITYSDSDTY